MIRRARAGALLLLAACASVGAVDVMTLEKDTLASKASFSKRTVVLMHDKDCPITKKFQPWFFAAANVLSRVPFGVMDMSGPAEPVAKAFGFAGGPVIKMFLRDNPDGKRIVDYVGPLELKALLAWCRALVGGEEHEHSRAAIEPPGMAGARKPDARSSGGKNSRLPPSVRAMAETMVREQRLQRVLQARGQRYVDEYEALVMARYKELIAELDGKTGDSTFGSQEANRVARDHVREMLLKNAPIDVREEIEADVNLGDDVAAMSRPAH